MRPRGLKFSNVGGQLIQITQLKEALAHLLTDLLLRQVQSWSLPIPG